MPSLKQLNEAVMAYIEEHPDDLITVVVDATFGHRIDTLRCPSSTPRSRTTSSCRRPPGRSAGATPSCSPSPTRPAPPSCPTTPSRSSTATTRGCSTRDAWSAASRYPTWAGCSCPARRCAGRSAGGPCATPGRGAGRDGAPRPPEQAGVRAACRSPRRRRPGGRAPGGADDAADAGRRRRVAGGRRAGLAGAPRGRRADAHRQRAPAVPRRSSSSTRSARPSRRRSSRTRRTAPTSRSDGVRGYVPLRFLGDPAPRSAREVLAMGETATFVVGELQPAAPGIDLAKPEFAPPSAAGAPASTSPAHAGVRRRRRRPPRSGPQGGGGAGGGRARRRAASPRRRPAGAGEEGGPRSGPARRRRRRRPRRSPRWRPRRRQ